MSPNRLSFDWLKSRDAPPMLDTGFLDRLGAQVGRPVLRELMSDGLIELADRMARLDEIAAAGDFAGMARLGHDLVGMAGNLGLSRLSAAAAELCRTARDKRPDSAEQARVLRRLGDEAAAALRAYLAGE